MAWINAVFARLWNPCWWFDPVTTESITGKSLTSDTTLTRPNCINFLNIDPPIMELVDVIDPLGRAQGSLVWVKPYEWWAFHYCPQCWIYLKSFGGVRGYCTFHSASFTLPDFVEYGSCDIDFPVSSVEWSFSLSFISLLSAHCACILVLSCLNM